MLAWLEAIFSDLHASATASRTLSSLMFDVHQDDINALTDKAKIRKLKDGAGRKGTLNSRCSNVK